ncbi:hypothetical protein EXIGLDRAFT_504121 [Exidia glandulosa HHB12029]|uniref:Uncharacterized protein n=1 Tax=Exidia glandulosa HHB12029 TaxID=1314781 RepID=A0A166N5W6_EXIGL|nr:hypothetical protein EXIGLDRAFT_504121 [Exidia glandulosa HHB12029]
MSRRAATRLSLRMHQSSRSGADSRSVNASTQLPKLRSETRLGRGITHEDLVESLLTSRRVNGERCALRTSRGRS